MKNYSFLVIIYLYLSKTLLVFIRNDAFGDAYEFLMAMYASNVGKSGGEYYTPQEVFELLTHLTLVGKTEVNKVYDIIVQKLIQFNYPKKCYV